VPDVADRHVAGEGAELLLVEDLGDQAELAQRGDVAALAGRDPRCLLATVLQGVETEVGEPGDVAARRVHAEDPALIARSIAIGNVETRVGHVLWRCLNLWRSKSGAGTQPARGG